MLGSSELANTHWHMCIYMTIVGQPLKTHDFPLLSKLKLRSHDISPTKTLEIHMASARPWGCKGSSSFKRAWILTTLLGHHPRAPLEALDHHQSRDPGFDPLLLLGKHTFKSSSYRLNGGFENIAISTIVMALFPMQSFFDHFWSGLSIFYVILSLRPLMNSRSSQSRPFATAPTDISTHWQREWLSVCTSNFVAWKSQDQQILRMLVFF